jgi:hypothetical protein
MVAGKQRIRGFLALLTLHISRIRIRDIYN